MPANGKLTISEGGKVSAQSLSLATTSSSSGKLIIGSESGSPLVAPGTVETSRVVFGPGDGQILLNHSSLNYVFDAAINNGANNDVGSNTGLVGSGRIEASAGRSILNADHRDFTGVLQVGGAGRVRLRPLHSASAFALLRAASLRISPLVWRRAFRRGRALISPGSARPSPSASRRRHPPAGSRSCAFPCLPGGSRGRGDRRPR